MPAGTPASEKSPVAEVSATSDVPESCTSVPALPVVASPCAVKRPATPPREIESNAAASATEPPGATVVGASVVLVKPAFESVTR